MAQSLSFFGNRRGSTKSHTYQVNGGQQITKDRVDEVKNPRTSAQMVHRCCLHTLSDAHAYLRPFIGGFWEGARSPQAALAAFRKANYPIIRAAVEDGNQNFSFSPYKENTTPAGLFQVSDGSLPQYRFKLKSPIVGATALSLSLDKTNSNNDYFEDVLFKNGVRVGDVLHVFAFYLSASTNRYVGRYAILRVANPGHVKWTSVPWASKFELIKASEGFAWGGTNLGSQFLSIRWNFTTGTSGNRLSRSICVIQRRENGRNQFSPSWMFGALNNNLLPTFQQAIATYPQGGGNVLDGGSV